MSFATTATLLSWGRQVVSGQRPTTPNQKEVQPVDLVQTARDHMQVAR
jgi:hypothetical protein